MKQLILTGAGEKAIVEFFDDIFGPGQYDEEIGICEVIETGDRVVGTEHYYGEFSHECRDTNGCSRLLYMYEGTHYTVHNVGDA